MKKTKNKIVIIYVIVGRGIVCQNGFIVVIALKLRITKLRITNHVTSVNIVKKGNSMDFSLINIVIHVCIGK